MIFTLSLATSKKSLASVGQVELGREKEDACVCGEVLVEIENY